MELYSLKYHRFDNTNKWSIGSAPDGESPVGYSNINLVVGKNASGKTSTIRAIRDLADLLSSERKINDLWYKSARYDACFHNGTDTITYSLEYHDAVVISEVLRINDELFLDRTNTEGRIYYSSMNELVAFKTDENLLAITRRDQQQHPFLDVLFEWGKNLSHYNFGSELGKNTGLRSTSVDVNEDFGLKASSVVVGLYTKAQAEYPALKDMVIHDMKKIGYEIEDIKTDALKFYSVYGLNVKERELPNYTDQAEMSQGMFRALSLLIQINYSVLKHITSCILIDDIGEGLDYSRSQLLIKLIIDKVKTNELQLFMTTNDRFTMNSIPLEYWHVIKRTRSKAIFYNEKNAPEAFEKFRFTGLNNFDFFANEFFLS